MRYHMIEYAEKFFGECWMRGGVDLASRVGEWDGKEWAMRAPVGSKIISGPVYGHMFQKTRPVGPACRHRESSLRPAAARDVSVVRVMWIKSWVEAGWKVTFL